MFCLLGACAVATPSAEGPAEEGGGLWSLSAAAFRLCWATVPPRSGSALKGEQVSPVVPPGTRLVCSFHPDGAHLGGLTGHGQAYSSPQLSLWPSALGRKPAPVPSRALHAALRASSSHPPGSQQGRGEDRAGWGWAAQSAAAQDSHQKEEGTWQPLR